MLIIARGGDVRLLAAMDGPKRRKLVDALTETDAIATNGRRLREDLREISPELSARAVVVDFGVDTELFCPATPAQRIAIRQQLGLDPAGKTLLFAGRWEVAPGQRVPYRWEGFQRSPGGVRAPLHRAPR